MFSLALVLLKSTTIYFVFKRAWLFWHHATKRSTSWCGVYSGLFTWLLETEGSFQLQELWALTRWHEDLLDWPPTRPFNISVSIAVQELRTYKWCNTLLFDHDVNNSEHNKIRIFFCRWHKHQAVNPNQRHLKVKSTVEFCLMAPASRYPTFYVYSYS